MKKVCAVSASVALFGMLVTAGPSFADKDFGYSKKNFRGTAKNIILMVPDGMGLSDVTATRVFKNGPNGEPLSFEKLPVIGYQRTHSANSLVTDSAAAAGAWATGEKYINGEISCHADGGTVCLDSPKTILEIAKERGKATGLVATSDITHATPAVFAAHIFSRNCEAEIGFQLLQTGVDVLLGGGIDKNSSNIGCPAVNSEDVIAAAPVMGYSVVETLDQLNDAVKNGQDQVLGLFKLKGKTPENFWLDESLGYPVDEPTLKEMTVSALDILEEDRNGFFLMVEGSQIDWADHANRLSLEDIEGYDPNDPYSAGPNTMLGEMLGFDAAVEAVMDWVNSSKKRQRNTLVIVVADHETGGFQINGPYGSMPEAGDIVEPGWTSTNHTAVDTLIWSQGPGSHELGRAVDNTDVFKVMRKYMSRR